jgi:lipopolysaccharide/colanic/teichoic acid biosynthesis glycosyltransferase
MKRILDLIFSAAFLTLLSPLLIACSLAVLIDSGRPVLYQGLRTGRYGRPFHMYKFRTMIVDAEKVGGTSTAENDPRITVTGGYLRRLKLDELPQLVNVLRGQMSFVGPRPEVEEYTSLYEGEEKKILDVRPGITDYASIRFRNLNAILATSDDPDKYYKDVIRPEKNRLRLQYALHNNLWIDLKILGGTFKAVFSRDTQRRTA